MSQLWRAPAASVTAADSLHCRVKAAKLSTRDLPAPLEPVKLHGHFSICRGQRLQREQRPIPHAMHVLAQREKVLGGL